jgi:hypothetical protein
MLVDMAYGVLYYRLLIGHAPLDNQAAQTLATHLIAAGSQRTASLYRNTKQGISGTLQAHS